MCELKANSVSAGVIERPPYQLTLHTSASPQDSALQGNFEKHCGLGSRGLTLGLMKIHQIRPGPPRKHGLLSLLPLLGMELMCTTLDKHGPTERRPAAKSLPLCPLPGDSHAGMTRYSARSELCPVS